MGQDIKHWISKSMLESLGQTLHCNGDALSSLFLPEVLCDSSKADAGEEVDGEPVCYVVSCLKQGVK